MHKQRNRRRIAGRAVAVAALFLCLPASPPASASDLVFYSDVKNATVYVNGIEMGKTALWEAGRKRWYCTLDLDDNVRHQLRMVDPMGREGSGPSAVLLRGDTDSEVAFLFRDENKEDRDPAVIRAAPQRETVTVPPPSSRPVPTHPSSATAGQSHALEYALAAMVLLLVLLCVVLFLVWVYKRSRYVNLVTEDSLILPSSHTMQTPTRVPGWPQPVRADNPHWMPRARIGQGGIASVYLVQDTRLSAYMAVKILHEQFCENDDGDLRARFLDEPMIMDRLRNTSVVPVVYARSRPNARRPWFAMEYLNGMMSLRRMIARHRDTVRAAAVPIMVSVIRATRMIHARGVIHRDLSPENVMLRVDGVCRTKIIDFGGAKFGRNVFSRDDFFHNLTPPGQQMGKIRYTAPEMWRRGMIAADAQSDAFSIGVMCWETVTGGPPFRGKTISEVCANQARNRIESAEVVRRRVSAVAAKTLYAMLAPSPGARPTLEQLEAALLA
jgi:hypothetical protein